jgi:hypothetical protein
VSAAVVDAPVAPALDLRPATSGDGLWVVQIDCNLGHGEPDWEDDWHPEPLAEALRHAEDLRRKGWIARIVPESASAGY